MVTLAKPRITFAKQKRELVISNKEPPQGSQIIKRVPGATVKEAPQAQEPGKPQPNAQPGDSPKPTKNK